MRSFVKRRVLCQTLGTEAGQELSEQVRALEREKKGNLVHACNPNSIQTPETNRKSLQIAAPAFLVLFRIVAAVVLGAATVAEPPKGQKPA